MEKTNYTVELLIHDPAFRRMVEGKASSEEIQKWSRWMQASDKHRQKAKQAMAEIAGFSLTDKTSVNIDNEWNRFQKNIAKKNGHQLHRLRPKGSVLQWMYRIAALLVVGTMVGWGIHWQLKEDASSKEKVTRVIDTHTLKTGAGENKTIEFSSGSKIVLSGNSTLTYRMDTTSDQTIEVTVEGEAYFDAESDPSQKQSVFTVQTPDGMVRDIGTEFLVTVKKDRSRVVLQKGKVEIKARNRQGFSKNMLRKGEMVEFNKSKVLIKQPVNATFYTSWATGFLEFNQTTLQDFARFVEQRFDVNVKIGKTAEVPVTMDGSIYFQSLAGLVRSVTDVADVRAYQSRDGETVYIGWAKNEKVNTE